MRKLLKIKWQDKIPDTEVLMKAGMQSMHTVLQLAQGGQNKRYKDTLNASLKDVDVPMGSWEQTAQERAKWRGLINKGAAVYDK